MISENKSNNNQENEYPKVVYEQENKNGSKIKQFLSLNLLVSALVLSPVIVGYLIYNVVWKRDVKSLIALITTTFHSTCIVGPNYFFSKFFEKMETLKWFDKFQIIVEEKIDEKKVLFSWMPHSILCFPSHFSRYNKKSPFYHSLLMGSRMALKLPIFGSMLQWNGTSGADPTNFKACMKSEKNIVFLPGGFEEASVSSNKEYRLWINDRKGFIKYAMQYGYKVHPVFTFNEMKGYKTSDFALSFRMWLNKYKLPGTLFFSKMGMLPENNIEVTVVVGKQVEIPQIDNPSQEQINQYHIKYIQEVQQLFNRHVDKYDPGAQLKIWGGEKPKL